MYFILCKCMRIHLNIFLEIKYILPKNSKNIYSFKILSIYPVTLNFLYAVYACIPFLFNQPFIFIDMMTCSDFI